MRRMTLLAVAALFAVVLGAGVAAAEPGKNQVTVPAECDNGEQVTFVLNAQGNAGKIAGSNSNIIPKSYVATYKDPVTGETLFVDVLEGGNKNGLRNSLVACHGETTYTDNKFGTVAVVFDFQGLITPRGRS